MVSRIPLNQHRNEDESVESSPCSDASTTLSDNGPARLQELKEIPRHDSPSAATPTRPSLSYEDSFAVITEAFDDPSQEVRNAAARSLYELQLDRSSSFITAFREALPERRCRIAGAMVDSGLAAEEVVNLSSDQIETAYDAFSLLFLMAKAGEVGPLVQAVEESQSTEVRRTLVQLLAECGQAEILPVLSRLALRQSLPAEVRSVLMQAIRQIRGPSF